MDEDEEIDVDDLFDNELEAASRCAEFDVYEQADDGNAIDDGRVTEERRAARIHNEWEELRSKEMLKSVWEKSKKQNSSEPSQQDSAGGANGQQPKGKTPRPKLTERELTGERGLAALRDSFADFEVDITLGPYANMSRLLDRMENWAHCLYPPLSFDDFLEKVEALGKKRLTKYALNNIRMGVVAEVDTEQIGNGRSSYEKVWDDDGGGDRQPGKNQESEELFDDFYDDDDYPVGHTSLPKEKINPKSPAQHSSPAIDEDTTEERGGEESEQNTSANPLFTPMNSDDEGERMEIWSRGQQGTTTKEDFSFIPASANRPKAYSTHPRRRAIISDDEESFDENELIADIELDEDGHQT